MAKLVSIAREHQCVVICSLHAPRSAIFSGIHDLLLLSAGGRVCYSGKAADAGNNNPGREVYVYVCVYERRQGKHTRVHLLSAFLLAKTGV